MFFRNLTLYRFSTGAARRFDNDLDARLAQQRARPCGALEMQTRGWVPPLGRGEEALSFPMGPYTLFTQGGEDKLLPAAIVNASLADRIDQLTAERGKPPGGRERRRLKDEVLTDLMPRALARPLRLNGYVDTKHGWLVVDTASRKAADGFVTQIRTTIDSFPALPLDPEEAPKSVMTEWISGSEMPDGMALGDECELRDPSQKSAIVRVKGMDLAGIEVKEHLKSGKQATQLGLVLDERVSFTLDENLVLRKLKFLEAVTEELETTERESVRDELQARFALMSLTMGGVLTRLEKIFGLARPRQQA